MEAIAIRKKRTNYPWRLQSRKVSNSFQPTHRLHPHPHGATWCDEVVAVPLPHCNEQNTVRCIMTQAGKRMIRWKTCRFRSHLCKALGQSLISFSSAYHKPVIESYSSEKATHGQSLLGTLENSTATAAWHAGSADTASLPAWHASLPALPHF